MKKGFTLIELITVIVILAVIGVITIPKIVDVINDSKIKSAYSSANGLIESANVYYSNLAISGSTLSTDLVIDFNNQSTIPSSFDFSGKYPDDGGLIIKTNGEILITENLKYENVYCGITNKEIKCSFDGGGTRLNFQYDSTTSKYYVDAESSQDAGIGKNLFNGTAYLTSNCTFNNGVVTQTIADTNSSLEWKIQGYNNSTYVKEIANSYVDNNKGTHKFTFTKDSTYNVIAVGLNGSARDTKIMINVSSLTNNKTYTISFNVTNNIQGTISWDKIQIEEGNKFTSYHKYHTIPYPGSETQLKNTISAGNYYTIINNYSYMFTIDSDLIELRDGTADRIWLDIANSTMSIQRKVGIEVSNETNNWRKDANADGTVDYFYYTFSPITSSNYTKIYNTRFSQGTSSTQGYWATTVYVITIDKSFTGITASDTTEERVTKFKKWIKKNNFTTYYELSSSTTSNIDYVKK